MTQARAAASRQQKKTGKARRFFYENGLSIVLFSCFLAFWAGQALTGHRQHNEDLKEHGQSSIALSEYLRSDHFLEATAENWESEFVQMFGYVLFTVFLYQKGSSESKKPGELEAVDREAKRSSKNVPWPVRKGGVILKLYENSLSLTFLLLFLIAFSLHATAGARLYSRRTTVAWQPARFSF